jgi:hypothetical protein
MVLEGLGRRLDPDVDLLESAKPLLRFREGDFYLDHGGLFLKLSAFLETRSWLKRSWDPSYAILDTLLFNNF